MIAFDFETTGSYFHHGCKPYLLAIAADQPIDGVDQYLMWWEWEVDPFTREVTIPRSDIREIERFWREGEWVDDDGNVIDVNHLLDEICAHNCPFDIMAALSAGIRLPDLDLFHCTMLSAHALRSGEPKGLKPLCTLEFGYDDDDESELQRVVMKARDYCRRYLPDWQLAEEGHKHFPSFKANRTKETRETDAWWKLDMWLPRALALFAMESPDDLPRAFPKGESPEHWESVCRTYCLCDVERALALRIRHKDYLRQLNLTQQYELQRRCIPPTIEIQLTGIPTKPDLLQATVENYTDRMDDLKGHLQRIAENPDFNPDSDPQLKALAFNDPDGFQLPVIYTTDTGNPSLKKEAIRDYLTMNLPDDSMEFIAVLSAWRAFKKALEYLNKYQVIQCRHPQFRTWSVMYTTLKIWGTEVTRFSSEDPNIQQIATGKDWAELLDILPWLEEYELKLREVFVPPPDRVWYPIDYSQMHLRIFAQQAGEQKMLETFRNNRDIHAVVSQAIYEDQFDPSSKPQRRVGKAINFGDIYGAGLDKQIEASGRDDLGEILEREFPDKYRYMEEIIAYAEEHGCIYTPGGYRLDVPWDSDYNGYKAYVGINYICQGSEGEIAKRALRDCWEYLSYTFKDLPLQPSKSYAIYLNNGKPIGKPLPKSSRNKKLILRPRMMLPLHDELLPDFPRRLPKKYGPVLDHVRHLADLMEESGRFYKMELPVEVSQCLSSWADQIDISPYVFPERHPGFPNNLSDHDRSSFQKKFTRALEQFSDCFSTRISKRIRKHLESVA